MSYGIVNQNQNDGSIKNPKDESAMEEIGIVSDDKLKTLLEILSNNCKITQNTAIAGLFTYFDCTDYKDTTNVNSIAKGVLTRALRKDILSFWDCLLLIFDNFLLGRNGHGGYFQGDLSKKILYGVAFLGFKDLLISLTDEPDFSEIIETIEAQTSTEAIQSSLQHQGVGIDSQNEAMIQLIKLSRLLSQKCDNKGIKVFLAPERYLVDILGKERNRKGY
jgi:hypothetical protein